jgi:hypothetical protein
VEEVLFVFYGMPEMLFIFNCIFFSKCVALVLAVELQPYGSKNLDGYRRAVVPPMQQPMHKT